MQDLMNIKVANQPMLDYYECESSKLKKVKECVMTVILFILNGDFICEVNIFH